MKEKTLLIHEDYVDLNGRSFITKNYPGKVEFVTRETIKEAIDNEKEDVMHLYLGQSAVSIFMYVYSTKGEIVLFESDVYSVSSGATKDLKLNNKNLKSLVSTLDKYVVK